MYLQLDPERIGATAERLSRRISERFPDSGLAAVSAELCVLARQTRQQALQLARPNWPLRVVLWGGLLALAAIALVFPVSIRVEAGFGGVSDLLQGIEAAINNVVFVAIAFYFLLTLEGRPKRSAALAALHQLRSVAHIIDMHQLTKDPESLLSSGVDTTSSPRRTLSRFELVRYLDYCSELLSIVSKLAALYAQVLNDSIVLNSVNDVQNIAQGLSAKIWQKIGIVNDIALQGERRPG
ncbi:MAG: hypothetical protein WC809_19515 [Sinimarinibacterium sp.]|jgi:hypothetical protein